MLPLIYMQFPMNDCVSTSLEVCVSICKTFKIYLIKSFTKYINFYIKYLKSVDQFTYLSSNMSSTETDINIHIGKAWTATDRLMIIYKSDLTDKIKWEFFQAVGVSVLLYGCTSCNLMKDLENKTRWELHRDAACCFRINPGSSALQNSSCIETYYPSHKPSK